MTDPLERFCELVGWPSSRADLECFMNDARLNNVSLGYHIKQELVRRGFRVRTSQSAAEGCEVYVDAMREGDWALVGGGLAGSEYRALVPAAIQALESKDG